MNIRPFTDDDAPVVAALISAEEERFYGRPGRVTGADILMYLQWSKESWVWEEEGRTVASASYGVYGDAANIRGVVADKGRGRSKCASAALRACQDLERIALRVERGLRLDGSRRAWDGPDR